jgi:hypothetical protein
MKMTPRHFPCKLAPSRELPERDGGERDLLLKKVETLKKQIYTLFMFQINTYIPRAHNNVRLLVYMYVYWIPLACYYVNSESQPSDRYAHLQALYKRRRSGARRA